MRRTKQTGEWTVFSANSADESCCWAGQGFSLRVLLSLDLGAARAADGLAKLTDRLVRRAAR
jgi:hypothetical protein